MAGRVVTIVVGGGIVVVVTVVGCGIVVIVVGCGTVVVVMTVVGDGTGARNQAAANADPAATTMAATKSIACTLVIALLEIRDLPNLRPPT